MKMYNRHQVCAAAAVVAKENFSPRFCIFPGFFLHKTHKFLLPSKRCVSYVKKIRSEIFKNEKVSIEKYHEEIGSLSSCFSNGFKWLYLRFG
jgi:hypothetical protein